MTLDPDVAARLRVEMKRSERGMKAVVNEALRRGLGIDRGARRPPPFKVVPRDLLFRPGIDLDRLNQLADQLDTTAFVVKERP